MQQDIGSSGQTPFCQSIRGSGRLTGDPEVSGTRVEMSVLPTTRNSGATSSGLSFERCYCLRASGGPLIRFPLRWKVTSTWSAILMNGIPLSIP